MIELKCSFLKRNLAVQDDCTNKTFCIEAVDGQQILKIKHLFYQCQEANFNNNDNVVEQAADLINVTDDFLDPDNIENKDHMEPGNLLVINNISENYNLYITDNKITKTKLLDFDVGSLKNEKPNASEVEGAVRRAPEKIPSQFPKDVNGHLFTVCILHASMKNGEYVPRDWLVWSKVKQSMFFFPCRLFSKLPTANRSRLSTIPGYCFQRKWKKLHDKIQEHQNSSNHKYCYIKWRQLEKTKRGLGFRGTSDLVGVAENANFLGILELLCHYDSVLKDHLNKLMKSQKLKRKKQATYLLPEMQNEFIECCAKKVLDVILSEREAGKYYSILVDATPDSAHMEQTVFTLCYVYLSEENLYLVQEQFLEFVGCNQKTGKAIAE
nr:uncharacterized protein LOC124811216 [Hydra vulgaris]